VSEAWHRHPPVCRPDPDLSVCRPGPRIGLFGDL